MKSGHLNEDGTPKYTNHLATETSPYLQHHAHNPVDWYPWGDEAFRDARAEHKPVHLSVGYSACLLVPKFGSQRASKTKTRHDS